MSEGGNAELSARAEVAKGVDHLKLDISGKFPALTPRGRNALDAAIKNEFPVLTPRREKAMILNGLEAAVKSDTPVRTPRRERALLLSGLEAAVKSDAPVRTPRHTGKEQDSANARGDLDASNEPDCPRLDMPPSCNTLSARKRNALEASLRTDMNGTPMRSCHPDRSQMELSTTDRDLSPADDYVRLDLPPKKAPHRPNGLEVALKTPVKTPVRPFPFSDTSILSQSMLSTSLLPEISADESKTSEMTPWRTNLTRTDSEMESDAKMQILSPAREVCTSDLASDHCEVPQPVSNHTLDMGDVAKSDLADSTCVVQATVELNTKAEFTVEEAGEDLTAGVVSGEVGFLGAGLHGSALGRRLLGGPFVPLSETPQKRPALLRLSRSSVGQIFSSPVAAEFTKKHLDEHGDEATIEQHGGQEDAEEAPRTESKAEVQKRLSYVEEQLKYWESMAKQEALSKTVDQKTVVGKIAYWEGVAEHTKQSLVAEEQRKSLLSSMCQSRRSLAASGRCSSERHDEHDIESDLLGLAASRMLAPSPEKEASVVDISAAPGGSYVPLEEADSALEDSKVEASAVADAPGAARLSASQLAEERESLLSTDERRSQQLGADASPEPAPAALIEAQPAHAPESAPGADNGSGRLATLPGDVEDDEEPRAPPTCLKASRTSKLLADKSISATAEELAEALQQAADASANESLARPARQHPTPKKTSSRLAGIGVQLKRIEGFVTVVDLAPRGPAAASLRKGDVIIAIDHLQTRYLPFSSILQLLRGPAESLLTLTIVAAGGDGQQTQVTLTRARMSSSSTATHPAAAVKPADLPSLRGHPSLSEHAACAALDDDSHDRSCLDSHSLLVPEDIADISPLCNEAKDPQPAAMVIAPCRISPPAPGDSAPALPEKASQGAAAPGKTGKTGISIDMLHSRLLQHLQTRSSCAEPRSATAVEPASNNGEAEDDTAREEERSAAPAEDAAPAIAPKSSQLNPAKGRAPTAPLQLTPAKLHLQVPGFAEPRGGHGAMERNLSANLSAIAPVSSPLGIDISVASALSVLTRQSSGGASSGSDRTIDAETTSLSEDPPLPAPQSGGSRRETDVDAPATAAATAATAPNPKSRAPALDNPQRKRVRTAPARDAPCISSKGYPTGHGAPPTLRPLDDENRPQNNSTRSQKRPLAHGSAALAPAPTLRRELRSAAHRATAPDANLKPRGPTGAGVTGKSQPRGRSVAHGPGPASEPQTRRREGKGIFRGKAAPEGGKALRGSGRGGGADGDRGEHGSESQDQYYLELGKMMEDLVKEIAPTEGPVDPTTVIKAISTLAAAGQRRLPSVGEEGEDEGGFCDIDEREEEEEDEEDEGQRERNGGGAEKKRRVQWGGGGGKADLVQEVVGLGRKGRWAGLYVGEDGEGEADDGGADQFQPFEEILRDRFAGHGRR